MIGLFNLPRPVLKPAIRLKKIVDAKRAPHRQTLNHLLPHLKAHFNTFASEFATLERFPQPVGLTETQTAALLNCWTSQTQALTELVVALRNNVPEKLRSLCPYCGIDHARTTDHYLPKALFPDLAVHAWNLVPCCDECNRRKRTKWVDGNGDLEILNFYDCPLPNGRFLEAELRFSRHGLPQVTFRLAQPRGTSPAQFDAIRRHVKALKLLERFTESANEHFSEVFESVRAHVSIGEAARIQGYLTAEANKLDALYTANHWKAATLRAMSASNGFVVLLLHDLFGVL